MSRQEQIERELRLAGRNGMDELIESLADGDFYTAPASTRFHGVYEGGLADHSYAVYIRLQEANMDLHLAIPDDTMAIAGLLHDICKAGAYIPAGDRYSSNKAHPKGHGALSVERVKRFIELTELEEKMILYHMGLYGLNEFDGAKGEYPLRGGGLANAWANHPAVKVMYFCDELATLEEKAKEGRQ